MAGVTPLWEKCRQSMRIQNEYVKEGIAEFLGTLILCMFAVGASTQAFIENTVAEAGGGQPASSTQAVLGGSFGLMTAILVTGGISGAHINPAVSVGLAIVGEVSWFKIPVYWVCQFLGGYVGSGLAVAMYKAKADAFRCNADHSACLPYNETIPANIFSPTPIGTAVGTGILDQIMCTAILLMGVLSIVDKRNMRVPKALLPFLICLIVTGITMSFGVNAGAVMNPARDLSPRLMALTIGYDVDQVMKFKRLVGEGYEHWWLVGIFGPLIGATLGSLMYVLLIGAHLNDVEDEGARGPSGEGNGSGNPGDWRSTRFIPKAQAPQPPQPQMQIQGGPNYNTGPAGPQYGGQPGQYGAQPSVGVNNNGYRDDMRYRQGY